MIKNILFLACTLICHFIYAQCVPDTDFTGLVGVADDAYVLEDTTGLNMGETIVEPTALPNAIVGDTYETFFNMRIPNDTVIEYDLGSGPQLFDPVYISTIGVNEIQGLPMGFSYECASQDSEGAITDMNCVFPGGGYGCLRLFSDEVPNVVGTYPLVVALDIVAEYEVFGIMIPVEVTDDALLNYLVLIVEENNNTSTAEIVDARAFRHLGLYPNPAENYFTLKFGNNQVGSVDFRMYDLLGNSIYAQEITTDIGYNEMSFDCSHLVPGIYSYTLSNGHQIITKQVIIK
jgi:hypothetical protein